MTIPRKNLVRALTGLSLSVLLLGAPLGYAADGVKPCRAGDTAATCRHSKGLLWKIERNGRPASHLFGTIHISDPRVTNLPRPIREAFDAARSFAMELILDGAGFVHMAETMFFDDGRTLEGTVGTGRYKEIQKLLTDRGLPVSDLNRKKPWVVVMTLSGPGQGGLFLDMQLQVNATLQEKPTRGLETMQEQLAVFDGLSIEDQVSMLDYSLRYHREMDKLLETMVQAYLARDLHRIMAIMDSAAMSDRRLQDTLMARLLTQRNLRMVDRMRPQLEEGNAFIAVGAAHLPGADGLLVLLERAGWRVTPVY
ncbi:MAG TPA: TraB/GumN family protein [Burkholderiales bacterium]|nr:TraB/GumN family protein [Burkholderiales bacterium]